MRSENHSMAPPATTPSSTSQPQLRTKLLMPSIATVRNGNARLLLANTLATCGTT